MKKIIGIIAFSAIIAFTACNSEASQTMADNMVSVESTELTSEEQTTEAVSTASEEKKEPEIKPEIMQIRNICKLATIQCSYNNVAKGVKEKGSGVSHVGEKDRTVWIEYSGTVQIGIDMSDIKMETNDTNITVTIPKAKILSITVDSDSYNEDSHVISEDGINSNPLTSEDETSIMSSAEDDMKKLILDNKSLLITAQDRAKKLIENYINQIGEITDVKYNITWEYE